MKIRTKILLSLGAISLFTPIAAYVVVIGSPRISFALRMNQHEVQQGFETQKLQTDLGAIESGFEDSMSETYRGKEYPAMSKSAEYQRELANSTLRSSLGEYESDLKLIGQSQTRQAEEAGRDGGGKGLGEMDMRETELLTELSNSLPKLKADIGTFVQLSDSHSDQKSEMVQNVLEPEVRDQLGKTVRDLAAVTEQTADGYRQNIEVALKESYKEIVFLAGLGLVVAIGLAILISRSVIAPIHELRDAAARFGKGNMEARISRQSEDELGELASSFNSMAEDVTNLISERTQTHAELSAANARLRNTMGELESRNHEAGTLTEMADLLQSCFTLEEASGVIASSAQQLFPGFSGAVSVFSASRNILEAVVTWGDTTFTDRVFGPNDCWALRRGRLHQSTTAEGAVRCAHYGSGSRMASLCTPLMAHGETLGILCLVANSGGALPPGESISEFNVNLAVSVAEQAALSFANLRLREKLRYQSVRDPLTGLFNRRYLDESLEREIPRALRMKRSLGVIMIDVDKFKGFNDMFGHDAGDTVLKELGDYLMKFIRRGDLACRYGGEEFTLILPEASLEDTRRRAEELRTTFQQLSLKHRDITLGKVTLSLGVASFPEHGSTPAELISAADRALLRAKAQGRNCVLVAETSPARVEALS